VESESSVLTETIIIPDAPSGEEVIFDESLPRPAKFGGMIGLLDL
jgi:hypothetical protein